MVDLPWDAHDTPQVRGRKAEKPMAKKDWRTHTPKFRRGVNQERYVY